MDWQPELEELANVDAWSYQAGGGLSCAEPAAWTALALLAHGQLEAAVRPTAWLASLQQSNGAIGISADEVAPRWPTSLAMLAWLGCELESTQSRFSENITAARDWAIGDFGRTSPRTPQLGHDTTLAGWSWAAETHSWMEPTCFFVRALTAIGLADHPRVQTGVQMIVDRLLQDGGCNYGNTSVLGQRLLPHVQPTGIAMWALAGQEANDPRIPNSLNYLAESVDGNTAAASLSFALLGLNAQGRRPAQADAWVKQKFQDASENKPISVYHRALLLLSVASNPMENEQ